MKRLFSLAFVLVLLSGCANRKSTTTASTPAPPPAPEMAEKTPPPSPEPQPEMNFEGGYWQPSALSDAPDLEYAVDREEVTSVWYLKAEALETMLEGEHEALEMPSPDGSMVVYRVLRGGEGTWFIESDNWRCGGVIQGSALDFNFTMRCSDQPEYILQPLLKGSKNFYALIVP